MISDVRRHDPAPPRLRLEPLLRSRRNGGSTSPCSSQTQWRHETHRVNATRRTSSLVGQDPLGKPPDSPSRTSPTCCRSTTRLGSDDATVASDREVHLYLTDYRSLYVAHVGGITADDMSDDDGGHVPAFYARRRGSTAIAGFSSGTSGASCSNDTLAVVEELKKLRNTRYNDRPVSIYEQGMVDLPLIVTRADGARFSIIPVRAALTGADASGASSTSSAVDSAPLNAISARTSSATRRGVDWNRRRARSSRGPRRRSATTAAIRRSTSRACSWTSRRRSRCRRICVVPSRTRRRASRAAAGERGRRHP